MPSGRATAATRMGVGSKLLRGGAGWDDCVHASGRELQPPRFEVVLQSLHHPRAAAGRREGLGRLIEGEDGWVARNSPVFTLRSVSLWGIISPISARNVKWILTLAAPEVPRGPPLPLLDIPAGEEFTIPEIGVHLRPKRVFTLVRNTHPPSPGGLPEGDPGGHDRAAGQVA
jgi:hypothetical protein